MIETVRASSVQTRLWALQQLVPADPVYNVSLGLRLSASLGTAVVEGAVAHLLSRHEVFRTSFPASDGVVRQRVHPDWQPPIHCWEDLVPPADRTARAEDIIHAATAEVFDLARAPAVRAGIVRFAPDDHLVYLIVHHLIIDQSSIQILIEDFERLLARGAPGVSESAEPYSSFARWEAAYLESEAYCKDLEKWRSKLAGAPVLVDLQTDRPRGKQPTFNGDVVRVVTPPGLYTGLRTRAREWRATSGIYLLALWVLQLYQRHRQRDIVLGSGIANRPSDRFARTVGCFTNTLPLRFQVDPDWSFRQLFEEVKSSCLAAFERRFVPYTELVKLAPQPSLIGPTYANVYYDFHSEGMSARDRVGTIHSSPVQVFNHRAKNDLTFNVTATPGGLNALIEYNTDLFERGSVERMARELPELLRHSLREPGAGITTLGAALARRPGRPAGKRAMPLRPLHVLFSATARQHPERIALRDGFRQVSYGELETWSSHVAFHLLARGIGRESIVGLSVPRSIESVVSVIGIWKAGAAYLPLDPAYGEARVRQMLNDARPAMVIGTASTLETLAWQGPAATVSDLLQRPPAASSDLPAVAEEDLAYVIYTSGSTGRPKGILVPHLVPWSRVIREFLPISAQEVFSHRTSLNFVDSIWEIFAPLIRGARSSILSGELVLDPRRLVSTLAAEGVTCIVVVPALLDLLLESVDGLDAQLPALRLWICGGDEISETLARKFHQRLPGRRLINSYGTSETWDIAWHELEPERQGRIPVGRQVPGVHTYVLDGDLKPVPIGTEGDLYIGGDLLSRGYLHRPDLTAQAFTCDPFSHGERIYRTGDRARVGADDLIYLAGRLNRQVKINAYRIELGEVEGALATHPAVRAAVVVCLSGTVGKSLVAFVLPRQPEPDLVGALERHLAGLLPPYALPGRIVVLASLPLTPSGKVDRQALLHKAEQQMVSDDPQQPTSPIEQRILAAVRKLLRSPAADATSSFFAIGGNSISAVLLISALHKEGIELSLPDVLLRRTVRELAKVARVRGPSAAVERLPFSDLPGESRRCLPAAAVDAFAATAMQQALLSETVTRPQELLNVFLVSVQVRAALDPASLQAALAQVVELHPALRSGLLFDDAGRLLQVVFELHHVAQQIRIEPTVSLSDFVEELRTALASARCAPLWRIALHQRPSGLHELTLVAHHAIFDAWSVGVFFRDLLLAYHSGLSRDTSGQVGALAALAAENVKVAASTSARDFWKRALGRWSAPALEQPGTGAGDEQGADLFEITLSRRALSRLTVIADREQVPLRNLLLAVHCESVGLWYGQQDVSTGVVGNTRGHAQEASDLIGLFVNVVPLRVRTGNTWAELARETLKFEKKAAPFALYPAAAIKAAVGSSCGLDIVFNYVNVAEIIPTSLIEEVSLLSRRSSVQSSIPLLVTFSVTREGSAVITLESRNRSWCSTELACLGRLYRDHLAALLRGADGAGADPARWLRPVQTRPFDSGRCLHQLIEEQVGRTPRAVAVIDGQQSLSYAELAERSEQLAHLLRARGVGPDEVVGVAVPSSVDMMVALLAILKAGGAYLPLDLSQGRARLQSILQRAAPRLIVAEVQEEALAGLPVLELRAALRSAAAIPAVPGDEEVTPDHLAYVIFTSGSTGEPKGVMVSHRSIVNRLQWMQAELMIHSGDVVMQKTPLSFDVSVWECFLPLLGGATLICARPQLQYDPDYLVFALPEHRVTTLHFVPQFLKEVLEHPRAAAGLRSVRRIVCSGEVLPPEVALRTWEVAPQVALYNLYGPTEAAVDVTWHRTERDWEARRVPIGQPIWNTAVHILNGLQPVPLGAAGEIFLEGVGLARGYLGRPDLTAERFLPSPYGPPGARMYRTGDHGRCLPEGNIEFLGRIDSEVKVSGVRINMAEIEAAMCGFSAVRAAVARLEQGRLCGYVVPRQELTFDLAAFREHVARHLPRAAIPSRYGLMSALPVSASGKLDRRADAAYAAARWVSDGSAVGAHPCTETEVQLTEIWKRVLRRSVLRVDEDFHAAGGDSIQAVRIVHALRLQGYALGVEDLLEHPTVQTLARFADRQQRTEAPPAPAGGAPAPARRSAPPGAITDMQRHVLERYQEGAVGSGIFHVQFAYRFQDRGLSLDAFQRALARVMERHAAFSSSFRAELAGWSQQINGPSSLPLTMVDWCRGRPADDLSAIRQHLEADRLARFEPGRGALVRFVLGPIDSERAWFVMSAHHAIYDGWSHRIFLGALLSAYAAEKGGRAEPEPSREAVFTELGGIQAAVEQRPEAQAFFASLPDRAAPTMKLAVTKPGSPRFEQLKQELDRELLVALLDRARQAKVSPKTLFAHAFGGAVRATLDRGHIGVVTNGRSAELSDPFGAVGLFWNVLPVACPPADRSTASLRTTQARLDAVDRFGNYPVGAIEGWADAVALVFRFINFSPLEALANRNELSVEETVVVDRYDFPFVLTTELSGHAFGATVSAQFEATRISSSAAGRLWRAFLTELEELRAQPAPEGVSSSLG